MKTYEYVVITLFGLTIVPYVLGVIFCALFLKGDYDLLRTWFIGFFALNAGITARLVVSSIKDILRRT